MQNIPLHKRAQPIDSTVVFDFAVSVRGLTEAWGRVWQNKGAAGGDNVSCHDFSRNAHQRLVGLSQNIRSGNYCPGPIRSVEIPKKNGEMRRLMIPCIADRIVQTAVTIGLTPYFEEEFEPSSYGYRPGRSVDQAVRQVDTLRTQGGRYVVDADIDNFFESVPHSAMMARLEASVSDGPLLLLIELWLGHACPSGRGLPQGSPLSPLLSNLYLDALDEAFAKKDARIVRYADDFVILCPDGTDAKGAYNRARDLLKDFGLLLNEEKTRIVSFEKGFRFLGHLFVRSVVLKTVEEDISSTQTLLQQIGQVDQVRSAAQVEQLRLAERTEKAGVDSRFHILYLVDKSRRLALRNKGFAIEEACGIGSDIAWQEVLSIHHKDLDRIEIGPGVVATDQAVRHAMATDTPLVYVNGYGETLGWVSPPLQPRAKRHLAQARLVLDDEQRLSLARTFVEGRLKNQRALLNRLNRQKKNATTLKSLVEINRTIRKLCIADGVESLMGMEGSATARFWTGYKPLLETRYGFRKRLRCPEHVDPVNILLNLTASMLARDIGVAITRAGLHPGFGALHATVDQRDSLVFDLMEEFRAPLSESVVAKAINSHIVTPDMFSKTGDNIWRLETHGLKVMIRAYEVAMRRRVKSAVDGKKQDWRGIMTQQAFLLASHFDGRQDYRPYVMDY